MIETAPLPQPVLIKPDHKTFVLGVAGIEPLAPVIANALAQPAPQGLTAQLREMESAR